MSVDPCGEDHEEVNLVAAAPLEIRIEAFDLPGRTCAPPDTDGYRNIHVAVQRRLPRAELLDPQPGDAAAAAWTLECTVARTGDGIDLRGAVIHGRPGQRFIYLSWGEVDAAGAFTMFRRAKLMLDGVDPAVLAEAVDGGRLVARLGLTDAKGHPLCAAVRPPRVEWSAPDAP